MPGPGTYGEKFDTLGTSQTNSRITNTPLNAFSKAYDRFGGPYTMNSSPFVYDSKGNEFSKFVRSEFKFRGATKFGRDSRTFIDVMWNPKEKERLPAPG